VVTIEKPVLNETYDIKASTLVRCIFGPLKCALEVKGRVLYQLDLDVGRLVILAICETLLVYTTIPSNLRTSNLLVDATQTSIHSLALEAEVRKAEKAVEQTPMTEWADRLSRDTCHVCSWFSVPDRRTAFQSQIFRWLRVGSVTNAGCFDPFDFGSSDASGTLQLMGQGMRGLTRLLITDTASTVTTVIRVLHTLTRGLRPVRYKLIHH
jgi:hypothetical protein